MRVSFLGRGGSADGDCPTLYATDRGSYLVQGWRTTRPETVEIPHLLTGFAEPEMYIGATMTDTGRGTFRLDGTPVTDPEMLAQLTIAEHEAAVEVPKKRRTFYGGVETG